MMVVVVVVVVVVMMMTMMMKHITPPDRASKERLTPLRSVRLQVKLSENKFNACKRKRVIGDAVQQDRVLCVKFSKGVGGFETCFTGVVCTAMSAVKQR